MLAAETDPAFDSMQLPQTENHHEHHAAVLK